MNLVVTCDRCGTNIEGTMTFGISGAVVIATSGFYLVQNTAWADCANPDEVVVCDTCMERDTRYQKRHETGERHDRTSN